MIKIFALLFLAMIFIPFASADMLIPGYKSLTINNVIDNIADYPDYVFIEVGRMGDRLCPVGLGTGKVIGENGSLTPIYKFCSISVYAVPKASFNETKIVKFNEVNISDREIVQDEFLQYVNSFGKEVIKDAGSYRMIPISSPLEEINNHYVFDLNSVKTSPDYVDIKWNYFGFISAIIISLLSLGTIIFILVRGKNE